MLTDAGRPLVDINEAEFTAVDSANAVPMLRWSADAEEARRAVGRAGEQALIRLLRECGVSQVRHVSAESDAYGYDIAASGDLAEKAHVEVKSTTDPTRLVIHLSRHEYEVMTADAQWCLAAVLVGRDGEALSVATVDRGWLCSAAPVDQVQRGRWESVRLEVPSEAIQPGLVMDTWRLISPSLFLSPFAWACRQPPGRFTDGSLALQLPSPPGRLQPGNKAGFGPLDDRQCCQRAGV
ncbi:protein NO VEIN domain-containing protein [Streptomyces sp. NPDC048590]|uniref:protein NO VEIN domain-containing protein n=1 Tax=Streptomyces sp. NPDC048590 TaxID=3365574 RepID=UPI003716C640